MNDPLRVRVAAIMLGVSTVMATIYGGLLFADLTLFVGAGIVWKRPPWWTWVLALPIGLSMFWAAVAWTPVWTAARIIALVVLWREAGRRDFRAVALTIIASLSLQTLVLPFLISHPRPPAFTANASVLGQVGLMAAMLFPVIPRPDRWGAWVTAFITVGISAARTPLLALGTFALASRSWRMAVLTGACFGLAIFASWRSGDLDRFTNHGIRRMMNIRVADITQDSPELTGPRLDFATQRAREKIAADTGQEIKLDAVRAPTEAEITAAALAYPQIPARLGWHGYGYDSFVPRTNNQGPHTIPILMVYEIGLLALPIFGVIGWAIWTRRIPLATVATLAVLWAFTEEEWSTGYGHYMLAAMLAAAIVGASAKAPHISSRAPPTQARSTERATVRQVHQP